MPYHLGRHKAKLPVKEPRCGLKERLGLAAFGLFVTIAGVRREIHGPLVWPNWYNQPIYPATLISVGAITFICALIPSAWFEKAAHRIVSRNREG